MVFHPSCYVSLVDQCYQPSPEGSIPLVKWCTTKFIEDTPRLGDDCVLIRVDISLLVQVLVLDNTSFLLLVHMCIGVGLGKLGPNNWLPHGMREIWRPSKGILSDRMSPLLGSKHKKTFEVYLF
ncbi:hypothetical protein CEXT_636321 [Caerostris extrusa]|uniref:Uncharacterized protein n=1 Tax=Caerostris extrusa TaxID=172846 RepID=A0AAV4RHN5_CAEEX|nr:hypothetical protein CEXT_636321 [Caerostris extrusa]